VPEDVTMEEPGSWLGSVEAEGHARGSGSGDIATRRIDEIDGLTRVRLEDPEVVSVKMDGMGIIIIIDRESDIDDLVLRKDEGILRNVEVAGFAGTIKDLDEGGGSRRDVRDVVNVPDSLAGGDLEDEGHVDVSSAAGVGDFGDQGDEVSFDESIVSGAGRHRGCWVGFGSTFVSEDGARESSVKVRVTSGSSADVRGVDPVVSDGLVSIDDDRVPLSSEDIDAVHHMRLDLDTISFDNGKRVLVDRECEFAADGLGNDTETVAFAWGDGGDGEGDFGTIIVTASTVDEA